jgi:hypothetical protein
VEANNGAARIEYCGVTDARADALLRVPQDPEERSARSKAIAFLCDELKDGPVMATAIEERARELGISKRTLDRAKKAVGVKSCNEGDGGWSWHLPGKENRKDAR